MDWRIKGGIQKILGVLPGGDYLHYRLQRRFGGLRDFAREFDIKMEDWRLMVGHLANARMPIVDSRLMEIGTGWYPTFPFACYLGGARSVVTFDLNCHLKPDLMRACADRLANFVDEIADTCGLDRHEVGKRQRDLADALSVSDDIEAATGGAVRYVAPGDATRTGLGSGQIDCIFSNSVLEHVTPDAIDGMYQEAMRILPSGGIMFHSVNCGDHYAYVDRRVSQLNYLKYSDASWRFWNNAFLYQNRMRAHEFVERAESVGFAIELNTAKANERRLQELSRIEIDTRFAGVPAERLCITSIDFIARKP